jgi:hypothetical protein
VAVGLRHARCSPVVEASGGPESLATSGRVLGTPPPPTAAPRAPALADARVSARQAPNAPLAPLGARAQRRGGGDERRPRMLAHALLVAATMASRPRLWQQPVAAPDAHHDFLLGDADVNDPTGLEDIYGDGEGDFCFDADQDVMDWLRRDVADLAAGAFLEEGQLTDLDHRRKCCKRGDCIFSLLHMQLPEVRARTLEIYALGTAWRAYEKGTGHRPDRPPPAADAVTVAPTVHRRRLSGDQKTFLRVAGPQGTRAGGGTRRALIPHDPSELLPRTRRRIRLIALRPLIRELADLGCCRAAQMVLGGASSDDLYKAPVGERTMLALLDLYSGPRLGAGRVLDDSASTPTG